MRYLSNPKPRIKAVATGRKFEGRQIYATLIPYAYQMRPGLVYEIPAGFLFDGASVPVKACRMTWICHEDRRFWPGALIHDFLYGAGLGSRKDADRAFYRELRRNGVSWITAQIMYRAVRAFGGDSFGTAAF